MNFIKTIVAAGLGSDIPAQPASGKITVKEAYGELRIPLLRDMPFFNRLDASIAGRWFDYSTSGSGDSTDTKPMPNLPIFDLSCSFVERKSTSSWFSMISRVMPSPRSRTLACMRCAVSS